MTTEEYIRTLREALRNASNALHGQFEGEYITLDMHEAAESARKEIREALALPVPSPVTGWRNGECHMWGECQDSIVNAYHNASQEHGHIESLFASCAAALDYYCPRKEPVSVEKVAIAVRAVEPCGLSLDGEHVFCDDPRLEGLRGGYNQPVRCTNCVCKEIARAAIGACGLTAEGDV